MAVKLLFIPLAEVFLFTQSRLFWEVTVLFACVYISVLFPLKNPTAAGHRTIRDALPPVHPQGSLSHTDEMN